MKRSPRRYVWTLSLLAVLAAAYGFRDAWLPAMGRWLDVGERPVKADYGFVAAGDVDSRPFAAALLYKYGYVREILLTRPSRHAGSARETKEFDELARAILEHEGVPAERIRIMTGDVHSTMDEAALLAPLIRAEPKASFVLITSDYHTRRTNWAFRHVVPEAAERLHSFSAPVGGIRADHWWRTEAGPTTYVSEYLRLGFYYVRYGAAGYVVASIVLALVAWKLARRYLRRDFFARRGVGRGRNSSTTAT